MTDRAVRSHESAHASVLVIAGWVPLLIRADAPTREFKGSVQLDWEAGPTPDHMRALLISILMAAAADGEYLELLDYPVNVDEWQDQLRSDAEQARLLTQWLGYDRLAWTKAVFDTRVLAQQPRYRRLSQALSRQLETNEFMTRDEILEVAEQVVT